jgi:arylformamidase
VHVRAGESGADALPLQAFHGPALVVDISDLEGAVSLETISSRFAEGTPVRLLLKTGRSIAGGAFPERWPFLTADCARAVASQGVVLLGVDCPSVDSRDSKALDVHHALFDAGAFVLENLDLTAVEPGRYELIAYPTKFAGLDAAPVRAVLID